MAKKQVKKRNWMVRCGRDSHLIEDFLSKGIIAVGWGDVGELSKKLSYEELKEQMNQNYNDWTKGKVNISAGQLWRFYNEFSIGDTVLTYDSSSRVYFIGEIKSDYYFDDAKEGTEHRRTVEWWDNDIGIDRDYLTVETKNTLGAIMTIFELSDNLILEIERAHPAYFSEEDHLEHEEALKEIEEMQEEQNMQMLKEEAINRSTEFIKDMISQLPWENLEILVAALFQAMGYKTRMTSRGSDLGSDILASPDGLGLTEPRIKIEVKKRTKDKIGAPEIRSFLGGLRTNEKGVYVCTGGFSKEARYESERANFALTLIDSDYFVDLILEHYEALSLEAKSILPLKRIYWPLQE